MGKPADCDDRGVLLYCRLEHREFPDSAFKEDVQWGTWHDVKDKPHTRGGLLLTWKDGKLVELIDPVVINPPAYL